MKTLPSWPSNLPKATPPNMITLGIMFQHINFGGIHSVYGKDIMIGNFSTLMININLHIREVQETPTELHLDVLYSNIKSQNKKKIESYGSWYINKTWQQY